MADAVDPALLSKQLGKQGNTDLSARISGSISICFVFYYRSVVDDVSFRNVYIQ